MADLQNELHRGDTRLPGTLALAIVAALAGSPAFADCSPAATTEGDVIVCDNSPAPGGADFNAQAGDDDVTITGGTHGNIFGNFGTDTITITGGTVSMIQGDFAFGNQMSLTPLGNDIINLLGGTVTGDVLGLQLSDTITLDGAAVQGNIYGGIDPVLQASWGGLYNNSGSNTFNLTSGSVAGGVFGEDGADSFTLNGATVTGTIYGAGGNDTFMLTSGSVNWLQGGEGADTFTLDGATVTLAIDGQEGNDTINLLSGSTAAVQGGLGADTITLDGATVTGSVDGGGDNDLITIDSGTYGTIYGGGDSDTITINGGTVASIQGDSVTVGGLLISPVGSDIINLLGGTVTGDVLGLQLGDTITLDGATVQGNIYGGIDPTFGAQFGIYDNSGGNTFNLTSGSVAGGVFGENGADTITLNGATITGVLDGAGGADTFTLTSGSAGSVEGGDGADDITLDGATIAGLIDGENDDDTIDLLSGSAGRVEGGDGVDTITLDGATIAGAIDGESGDDVITINSGSAGVVYGNVGSDSITLNGGTVAAIQGDYMTSSLLLVSPVGADTINLLGGTVTGDVLGLQLGDTITLDGTTVQGNIYGGIDPVNGAFFDVGYDNAGANTFVLTSGSVAGGVFGERGGDTFTLNGAAITGALDGAAGNDTFTLTSGSVGSVLGGNGSDTATLNGFDLADLAGNLDGGDDTSTGDGFIDTLNVGTSGTIDGARLLNWEVINLTAGQALHLTGGGLTTSSETGYGFSIAGGSALSFGGSFTLTGNLANTGALDLSGVGATAGDVLTVTGDFGGGGTLFLDADLDAMTSDRLVVNGTISGNHAITINNLTPASEGGPTGSGVGAGLVLVDNSAGPGVADGQFALSSPITAGLYRYDLSAESDGILYLQSLLLGEAAAYGILGEVMRDSFPTLRERLGQRAYALGGSGVGQDVWASVSSDRRKVRPDETNPLFGGDWDENRREITIGVDVARFVLGGGDVVGALGLHVISGNATTFGSALSTGDGSVASEGFGLGGALTWFGANDAYVDVQGRLTRWDLSAGSADAAGRTDGKSWGLSVEAGQRLALGESGALTPRVQLVWSEGRFDGFTDDMGTTVEAGTTDSLILSSGLTYERQLAGGTVLFADLAVYRDFADDTGVVSEGTTILSGASESWGKLSLGASLPVSDSGSAYLAARGSRSLDAGAGDDLSVGFEAGLRLKF